MMRRRCAIYTRKSTEEGLDQAFNSLDAQREACAAYIKSQHHEGWRENPESYDDGGFSGGSLERPGLQRLLDDVEAGRIDVVVVYKVDRLTRALSDFARIVEIFDVAGVSFVSVTQAFNTTTSMGRLTLNVLLSFAQFEREVTAERIRDKIAASKKKGMWMGGPPPLGYDNVEKALQVNPAEAKTVRTIFRRYLDLGSVRALRADLDRAGIVSMRRTYRTGRIAGGGRFSRGALYTILRNPLYVGEIAHRGERHPGLHVPIIERAVWEEAQQLLRAHGGTPITGMRRPTERLLTGLLYDRHGRPMVLSYASRPVKAEQATVKKRYWYYVSRKSGEADDTRALRLPAGQIETLVIETVAGHLSDPARIAALLRSAGALPEMIGPAIERAATSAAALGAALGEVSSRPGQNPVHTLVQRVDVSERQITLYLRPDSLVGDLHNSDASLQPLVIGAELSMRQSGRARPIVIRSETSGPHRDPDLIALMADARRWMDELIAGRSASVDEITRRERKPKGAISRIPPLAFLAPDISRAILEGRQPPDLTARRLRTLPDLPSDWAEQRKLLRIPAT